jgi:hypothetical protein
VATRKSHFANIPEPMDTDTGHSVYGNWATGLHTAPYPMMSWNNSLVAKPDRRAPTSDVETKPRAARRYVNMGVTDVQLNNGLRSRVGAGLRTGYQGTGYLYAVAPIIPGQTRDNAAGFHVRGPSPLNVQAMWEAGPGSQPDNPGGPAKIAAPVFINPMTG